MIRKRPKLLRLAPWVVTLAGLCVGWASAAPADVPGVRFTVGEGPLLECLRAMMPQTITVGTRNASIDLVLQEPDHLVLKDGKASLKVRVKGKTLPVDQILSPVVRVEYDQTLDRYFGVISSLPIQLPVLGSTDLRDYLPRFEIPANLDHLWSVADRPVGLSLHIRRIAILEHVLEVGADVRFGPVVLPGSSGTR